VSCAGPRPPCSRPAAHETASRGGDEGFSLIEVMTAMVMTAIVVFQSREPQSGLRAGRHWPKGDSRNALARRGGSDEALPHATSKRGATLCG